MLVFKELFRHDQLISTNGFEALTLKEEVLKETCGT